VSDLENKKITVLHIAGTGRNGSTLMERVLNEIPGVFAAGELNKWYWYKDQFCFCGKKIDECPVWGNLVNNDATFKEEIDKNFFETRTKYCDRTNFIHFLIKKRMSDDFKQYLYSLRRLYSAIQKNRACEVITDSSASLMYGYYLSLIPSIDLYVVHLVRDPRGFAHSLSQPKFRPNSNVS
jgi:hypothetical protein